MQGSQKILVLGGGVIGCTAAYELAKDGHEVTLIERQSGPALETSFANAGEVSPGYSAPWAGPGVPVKAVKWLLMNHRPLVLRPHLDLAMVGWILAMLRNCTQARYELNKSRMVRLAEYSRDCMKVLREQTGIRYDERMQGTLQLFRTQKQLDGIGSDTAILDRYNVPYQVLDRDGCITHEPALAKVKDKYVGGLRLPGDETGDCHLFTQRIAELATQHGAKFRFGESIESLLTDGKRLTGIVVSKDGQQSRLQADAYLLALGSHSPKLLSPVGVNVPVYPVKGYSITVPITSASGAPESTVMDETHKVAVTRLGDRIRVGGTAELAGYTLKLHEARKRTLLHVVGDLFPEGGDLGQAEFWCGLRPMTPDGTPLVGPTFMPNLWLATGHGTLGWTMAAGTARVMADLIGGRKPEIEMEGLTVGRYG
jgi:D-amino-acid dehydrogenase